MNQSKDEQVKNFWRFHRPASDAARALGLPLAQVEAIYEASTVSQNYREALLKVVTQRLKVLVVLLLAVPLLHAQTVSPVIVELSSKKAKPVTGSFTITNNSLVPITVVVEPPQSLTFPDGKPSVGTLAPTVHVELSEQSARVGAKQQHNFYYKLQCDSRPCALVVYTTIMGSHAQKGLAVAIHLPHVVYLCEKQKNCRAQVTKGGKP